MLGSNLFRQLRQKPSLIVNRIDDQRVSFSKLFFLELLFARIREFKH